MVDKITKPGDLGDKAFDKAKEGLSTSDQPDDDSAGRFAELVSGDLKSPPQAAYETAAAEGVIADDPGLTLGDKVLRGMQGLRNHVEDRADLVKGHLAPGEAMSMKDMFNTQLAMTNLMVTEDYIGKIVSKSTQTFDTLLRNQ
ncbi:EscI/YscI/HrpB family type III secretion system inner rod protein [Endozoicomonas ascidiicola]|uniref:EscI/YscI/HrpB family type III secretion system inner rod protein n=1 Tax=Endozoicomonas ascidiicola TaxID=1698521 RepID=UPI00082D9577|nr:EscI/YscI/HrpB family type III secretion system inner rod protein [Endozoicomonas ascidiicola]